ncbi:hypothetical protein [Streptomyces griseoloalbus]|uniref:Uncharacterized protein n=1 Tax=Streptomyces griseoloalbus TaxID=67303 RepID=A0A7W8FB13_9ACTN|nr:hypothetical protein [Streptomyces albaduncus]MBB5129783.1 hypothetical protein [Streptomyces albaduncus]GGW82884.1 hypothetical protein GCM10010340_70570 [Streptomyces albaduncus]
MPELDSDVIYDHLPDGTILDPIPFHDAETLFALLRERMTPQALQDLTEELRRAAPNPSA